MEHFRQKASAKLLPSLPVFSTRCFYMCSFAGGNQQQMLDREMALICCSRVRCAIYDGTLGGTVSA
jgi:hypothetical protein